MRRAAVITLLLLAAVPASTSAAPVRIAPLTLFNTGHLVGVRVGVSPVDEAVTVVLKDDGSSEPSLISRVRGASGKLAVAQELSRDTRTQLPDAVEFNSSGTTMLTWPLSGTFDSGVRAFRSAGGLFSVPFSWDLGDCGRVQAVKFLASGKPNVICSTGFGATFDDVRFVSMVGTTNDGEYFGVPETLTSPVAGARIAGKPQLEVGANGTRAAMWTVRTVSGATVIDDIRVSTAPPGGSFRASQSAIIVPISAGSTVPAFDMAVLDDGKVVLLAEMINGAGDSSTFFAVLGADGTAAGSPGVLTTSPDSSAQVEADGNSALFAWRERLIRGSNHSIHVGRFTPGSAVVKTTLDASSASDLGPLRIGRTGKAMLGRATTEGDGSRTLSAWTRAGSGKAFEGPVTIGNVDPPFGTFDMALDKHGSVAAVWTEGIGPDKVFLGGLDAAGPTLSGLSVPSRMRAGRAGRFKVTAIDPEGMKGIQWNFGDRGTSSSASARHSYRRAGRYRVVLKATDKFGKVTRVTKTVRVTG